MQLGRFETNKIYNEDCYNAIKDLPDKCVDLIITDPPYEIEGLSNKPHGIFAVDGHTRKYEQELMNTDLGKGIDDSILDEWVRILKKINIYIWCNKSQILSYLKFFVEKHKCNFEFIIWNKLNVPPFTSGHYLKDKEYCIYFWQTGVKVKPNFETGKTVYTSMVNIDDKKTYNHPTIKPIEIINNLVVNSSNANDIVLDCFLGSGTTAVACKETGRQYIGFEINEKYFKIAQDRLNGITKDGQTTIFTDFEQADIFDFIEEE